ncbi:hypothetical protein SARC_00296 [Sphaeroforma arctica JP610]|uniref:Fork-head domain-containing protein n=1 Tax=Sphaeroforma arctica JP610 TaxID=667725 RepID=A0A0L0GEZ6_9EUKA|nr:hypothetical protein SARC_00296 [Sphaeroforma arctica JP610]KNC87595.1 hypothetical protein SARC_00296 [Sphaeroforma arctica JP610]|eukprot:XP_014161497.1 hypothetical protein SARC_00296 [Sphaeroforma arctica JP610]
MNTEENDTEAWIRMITSKPNQSCTLGGVGVTMANSDAYNNAPGALMPGHNQLVAINESSDTVFNGEGHRRKIRRNSLPSNSVQFSPYWNAGRSHQPLQNFMHVQADDTFDRSIDANNELVQRTRSGTIQSSESYSYFNTLNHPPESQALSKGGAHRQSTGQLASNGRAPVRQQFSDSQHLHQQLSDFKNNRHILGMNNENYLCSYVGDNTLIGGDMDYYSNLQSYNSQRNGFVVNSGGFEQQNQNELSKLLNSMPYANGMDSRAGLSPQIFGAQQQILNHQPPMPQVPVPQVAEKQPHSYASLIGMAILNSKDLRVTLSEIYTWINENFPFFKKEKSGSWQSSVRHNLTFNESFVKKVVTTADGKRNYWTVDPESRHYFSDQGEYIRHRGRRNKAAAAKDKSAKEKTAKEKKVKAKTGTKVVVLEKKAKGVHLDGDKTVLKSHIIKSVHSEVGIDEAVQVKTKQSRLRKSMELSLPYSGLSSLEELSTSKGKRHRANPDPTPTAVVRTQSLGSISNSQPSTEFSVLQGNARLSMLQGKPVLPTLYSGLHLNDTALTRMPGNRCSMPLTTEVSQSDRRASAPDVQEQLVFDDMVQELSLGEKGYENSFPITPNVESFDISSDTQRQGSDGHQSQMKPMNPGEDPNYTWLSTMSASQKQEVPLLKYEPLSMNPEAQSVHMNTPTSNLNPRLTPSQQVGAVEGGLEQLYRDANGFLNSL